MSTENYTDPVTHTSVPFYFFLTKNAFDNLNPNPWVLNDDLQYYYLNTGYTNGVTDPLGNILFGNVVGVEETMGIYSGWSSRRTSFLANMVPCNDTASPFSSWIYRMNTYCVNCTITSLPTLACVQVDNDDPGPSGGGDPTNPKTQYLYDRIHIWDSIWGDTQTKIPTYIEVNAIIETFTISGNSNQIQVDGLNGFNLERLDIPSTPIELSIDSLINSNGVLS